MNRLSYLHKIQKEHDIALLIQW